MNTVTLLTFVKDNFYKIQETFNVFGIYLKCNGRGEYMFTLYVILIIFKRLDLLFKTTCGDSSFSIHHLTEIKILSLYCTINLTEQGYKMNGFY